MDTRSRLAGAGGPLAFALLVAAALCCRVPEAVFAPDGARVAWLAVDADGVVAVHVGDVEDGGAHEVLRLGPSHGMLRPLFDDAGTLWVLATRDEPEGLDVYVVRDDGPEHVIALDGPEADVGFVFPACIVGERWLWSTQLVESEEAEWQRLDLTSGEVDAPFGELLVIRGVGSAGEFALTLREEQREHADGEPEQTSAVEPSILTLVAADLAAARLAELRTLDESLWGAHRELAVFSGLAVGVERLALIVQSREGAWKATPEEAAQEGFVPPRDAELVLLDLHGNELERRELTGVRLVSGHRLTGDDRWLWALAMVDGGELVLLREDLRDGGRVQLRLGDALSDDANELFFQARLGGSRDGRRVSLQLLGEEIGAPAGRALVFDGESDGPLEPLATFGGDG